MTRSSQGIEPPPAPERFTLQGRRAWDTEREARLDLLRRLHRYDTVRRHSRLRHRSPIAHERALRTTPTTPAEAAQPVFRIKGQGPIHPEAVRGDGGRAVTGRGEVRFLGR